MAKQLGAESPPHAGSWGGGEGTTTGSGAVCVTGAVLLGVDGA